MVRFARAALDDSLVTTTVYALIVLPSWAVTIVVMVFGPVTNGMLADAEPLVTAVPFTFIVAVASLAVGVNVIEAVALPTDAV